ncbi:MAG: STAS domain-containing protein [Proteobacteria bacterium]|nr:STAS domain-containing protein [Pseudomonadota bacterium]
MAQLNGVENNVAIIMIDEDFNFETHKSFRNAVKESLELGAKEIILEFEKVEYMDSTALGLLMVAKDTATEADCKIKLKSVSGYARKILEMSQFDQKFELID